MSRPVAPEHRIERVNPLNRLWVRVALACAVVGLSGVFVATVSVNRDVRERFGHYLTESLVFGPRRGEGARALEAELAAHYAAVGGWDGAGEVVKKVFEGTPPPIRIADSRGQVVFDTADGPGRDGPAGELSRRELRRARRLEVDGTTVGWISVAPAPPSFVVGPARDFLAQLNNALLRGAALAGIVAAVLGTLLARSLTAPLARLTGAAHAVAAGDLGHRVPEEGGAEMAELAAAFNNMSSALQRGEEARRELVADLAHEIRTPLTVIQGSLRAILDGVYPLTRDEVAIVYEEALTASRLVTDLSSLAAVDAGHLTLVRQRVDLRVLLAEIAEVHTASAREIDVQVVADPPADEIPATVEADPDRLRQILHNLVSNAVRYSPPGQAVRIGWRHAVPTSVQMLRIEVTDQGPGLTVAEQERVFDRLWRADPSRSRDGGGSGLGLAIARSLVEAHGGEIGVESVPGHGATFWFTLPLWKEKGAGSSPP